jgi:pullulanase/glycogen debranching enzyme
MQNWTRVEGTCHPLGIGFIADEQAYNFAFYSKHAWAVTLLLFRADDLDTPRRVKILMRLPDGNISTAHLSVPYNGLIRHHDSLLS